MRYRLLPAPLATMLISFTGLFAQAPNKLNIIFHQFSFADTVAHREHAQVLHDLTLNNLLNLNKFNIVNRSPEMLKVIENELVMKDFISPATATRLGEMAGGNYYLDGKVSQFTCERKQKDNPQHTIDYYFDCSIAASLKLVNLQTGLYEENLVAESHQQSNDRAGAIRKALQEVSAALVSKLSKKFLIEAHIKSTSAPDNVVLDKGNLDGIRAQQSFVLKGQNAMK